jgi:hypothetical protein
MNARVSLLVVSVLLTSPIAAQTSLHDAFDAKPTRRRSRASVNVSLDSPVIRRPKI